MHTGLFSSLMEPLKAFSALAMVTSAVLTLLPEGTLRKTVSMAAALMMMLLWAEGLSGYLPPGWNAAPAGECLMDTGVTLSDISSGAQEYLLPPGGEGP